MSDPSCIPQVAWTEEHVSTVQGELLAGSDICQEEDYLEMFHSVLSHNDLHAREQFQHQMRAVVLEWIHIHPRREIACQGENDENYVEQAFACFWQVVAQRNTADFGSFATVLHYLQLSINGVMLDAIRASMRSGMRSSLRYDKGEEIWKCIQNLLLEKRQQRIAYLLFHCGLQPNEIVQTYPAEFSEVSEIDLIRSQTIEGVQSWSEST